MKTVIVVFSFILLAWSQTTIDRIIVDDFNTGTNSILITIPANAVFPIVDTSIYTSTGNPSNLLGGERDLQLTVLKGSQNRILSTQVNPGEWNTATPNAASGVCVMQWDGKDNSVDLNPNGLGGIDLTDGGLGYRIHATIEADLDTTYTFKVYSPNGGVCTQDVSVPGTQEQAEYYVNFDDFSGNCDFTKTGAIEISIAADDNVDSIIYLVAINGLPDPVTPTPSRTPSPPPIIPSAPPTPTPTPSPSIIPPMPCMCHCPAFTCELVFDPDDDENNVYYFDDDDEINASGSGVATSLNTSDQNGGGNGNSVGGGISGGGNSGGISGVGGNSGAGNSGNDSGNGANNAGLLKVSLVCVIAAFALF